MAGGSGKASIKQRDSGHRGQQCFFKKKQHNIKAFPSRRTKLFDVILSRSIIFQDLSRIELRPEMIELPNVGQEQNV